MSDLSYQRFEANEGDTKARFIVNVPELDDLLIPPPDGLLIQISDSHIGIHGEVAEGVDIRDFIETAERSFTFADEHEGKRRPITGAVCNSLGESHLMSTVHRPLVLRRLLALIPGFEPAVNINRPLDPATLEFLGQDLQEIESLQFSRDIPHSHHPLRLTYEKMLVKAELRSSRGRIAVQAAMGMDPEYAGEKSVHEFLAGMYSPEREDGPEMFGELMLELTQEARV